MTARVECPRVDFYIENRLSDKDPPLLPSATPQDQRFDQESSRKRPSLEPRHTRKMVAGNLLCLGPEYPEKMTIQGLKKGSLRHGTRKHHSALTSPHTIKTLEQRPKHSQNIIIETLVIMPLPS